MFKKSISGYNCCCRKIKGYLSTEQKSLFQAGQTLLEILLAFSVSVTVLGAIVVSVIASLNKVQYTKNQNLANFYAKQGMTAVRSLRDSDWDNFSSYPTGTKYCIKSDLTLAEPPVSENCKEELAVGADGIFSREVVFEHKSGYCCPDTGATCSATVAGTKVTVIVAWNDGKCSADNKYCHKAELITCLFNIDAIGAILTPTLALIPAGP